MDVPDRTRASARREQWIGWVSIGRPAETAPLDHILWYVGLLFLRGTLHDPFDILILLEFVLKSIPDSIGMVDDTGGVNFKFLLIFDLLHGKFYPPDLQNISLLDVVFLWKMVRLQKSYDFSVVVFETPDDEIHVFVEILALYFNLGLGVAFQIKGVYLLMLVILSLY